MGLRDNVPSARSEGVDIALETLVALSHPRLTSQSTDRALSEYAYTGHGARAAALRGDR